MSKKRLNIQGIANELEGASLFFQKPAPPPPPSENRAPTRPNIPAVEAKNERSDERTNERTNVRRTDEKSRERVRHSFDVFKDQLVELQALQLAAVRQGKSKPKLGDMVQRAIDLYLKKRSG